MVENKEKTENSEETSATTEYEERKDLIKRA